MNQKILNIYRDYFGGFRMTHQYIDILKYYRITTELKMCGYDYILE